MMKNPILNLALGAALITSFSFTYKKEKEDKLDGTFQVFVNSFKEIEEGLQWLFSKDDEPLGLIVHLDPWQDLTPRVPPKLCTTISGENFLTLKNSNISNGEFRSCKSAVIVPIC